VWSLTAGALACQSRCDYPSEQAEALEQLDFAIAKFREMRMQPSLERSLRHKGLLEA
jgi:hypothetical protein